MIKVWKAWRIKDKNKQESKRRSAVQTTISVFATSLFDLINQNLIKFESQCRKFEKLETSTDRPQ